ncbi:MAG: hypothetical protein JST22_17725 [Bacteroidetes bacterium]|nr:hypothetical protein [Bacteroidota bacterium]
MNRMLSVDRRWMWLAIAVLALLAAPVAFTGVIHAQPAGLPAGLPPPSPDDMPGPLVFSGSSRIYGQIANRRGTYQYTPEDFATLELHPSLAFYGAPFTLNVLLSTEQSTYRQNINSVSFDFDYHKLEGTLLDRAYAKLGELDDLKALAEATGGVEKLRDSLERVGSDKLRDVDHLKDYADLDRLKDHALSEGIDKLDELGLVSGAEKFFANFPAISVGVTYPNYTSLTLSSVPVTGFNIEWNPGNFYIATCAGRAQQAIVVPGVVGNVSGVVDSVLVNPAYSRKLYAARIGYGKKEGAHVILTGVYAKDDQSSLPLDTNGSPLTPMANYVLGLDVSVPIVEKYLDVQGEVAGSMLTGDISAAQIKSNDIPDFIRTTFDPNISSLIDYAYAGKAVLHVPESGTKLSASIRKIGPVFFSLGVPTLRNDNLRWEGRLEQRLLDGRINAAAYYKHDQDDLYPGLQSSLSTITSLGLSLGLNFPNLPYLRLEYAPYQQRYSRTEDNADVVNRTTLLSASAGYFYRIGGLRAGTTASYSSQQSNTFEALSDYGVATASIGQSITFDVPLMLQAGFTTSSLSAGDSAQHIISFDLATSYTAFKIWTNTVGVTLADQSGSDNTLGFSLTSSVQLWQNGFFEVRAEKNAYKNLLVTAANFDEFLFTASLVTTW